MVTLIYMHNHSQQIHTGYLGLKNVITFVFPCALLVFFVCDVPGNIGTAVTEPLLEEALKRGLVNVDYLMEIYF